MIRQIFRRIGEFDPFVRLTAKRAKICLAATEETAERLRRLGSKKISLFSNVGIPVEEFNRLSKIPLVRNGPFRILSIGRLIHWKGFSLSLKVFDEFLKGNKNSEYWIIGDGPERKKLEKFFEENGILNRVNFLRQLKRSAVMNRFKDCDVLIQPTLHDSGGVGLP